jgi:hypothetical protein
MAGLGATCVVIGVDQLVSLHDIEVAADSVFEPLAIVYCPYRLGCCPSTARGDVSPIVPTDEVDLPAPRGFGAGRGLTRKDKELD